MNAAISFCPNIRDDDAISGVAKLRLIEARIACEECRIAVSAQQHDSLLIFHTFTSEIHPQPALLPAAMPEEAGVVHSGYSRREQSSQRSGKHVFGSSVLAGMIVKRLTRQ
jgi:hypothetical protein